MTKPQTPKRVGSQWVTGLSVDRSGLYRYTHLIRSTEDPEPIERAQRGRKSLDWLTDFHDSTYPQWKEAIINLLSDGCPRTFNRIVLELTGLIHTADVAFDKAPDRALWDLVQEGLVFHNTDAPILFRRTIP